ncbi:OmpA/MotB family protein [Marinomonas mediterranea]|uniref:OmpA/MotB domain protein n=1 Tax=Marinomonas mediterranea (strain ATCC 700492 / JCM 21426 / NBRC 103028 / MMB-1) TaxID=717774 RepID=F2K3Y8_MARM1|nr:OmpA family protein [Marinomonas mediterranea]ADZ91330.1 OmpA/MotB domain protein [Marinomonas mediterranea MMB-1]
MQDPLFEEEEVAGWIVTYADLMSLLLVFFILLYSLSKLTESTLVSALSSIQIALNSEGALTRLNPTQYSGGGTEIIKPADPQLATNDDLTYSKEPIDDVEREHVKEIANDTANKFAAENLDSQIAVFEDGEKITIRVDGASLFESGEADVLWSAEPIFEALYRIFVTYPDYNISIKGHTDNIPINTTRFPSNWELSAIRATTTLRYFLEKGIPPERMTATGYADVIPLVPNDTPEHRAQNRRAEFVLQRNKNNN